MESYKKGVKCPDCHSFEMDILSSRLFMCSDCGVVVGVENQIRDYFLHYAKIIPDEVYTRRDIKEHINIGLSEYTLQKVIKSSFRKLDNRERIYYFSP